MQQQARFTLKSYLFIMIFYTAKTYDYGKNIDEKFTNASKQGYIIKNIGTRKSFLMHPKMPSSETESQREKDCNCGIPNKSKSPKSFNRIIGGQDAEVDKWNCANCAV